MSKNQKQQQSCACIARNKPIGQQQQKRLKKDMRRTRNYRTLQASISKQHLIRQLKDAVIRVSSSQTENPQQLTSLLILWCKPILFPRSAQNSPIGAQSNEKIPVDKDKQICSKGDKVLPIGKPIERLQQQKNNQNQVVKVFLQKIIVMILDSNSGDNKENHSQPHTDNKQSQNEIRDNRICRTQIECAPDSTRHHTQDQSLNCSFKQIKIHPECNQQQKPKCGLEMVLEKLREERRTGANQREQKKKAFFKLWQQIGPLMALEKQKFYENLTITSNQAQKDRLLKEFQNKNINNHKIIKKFTKKASTIGPLPLFKDSRPSFNQWIETQIEEKQQKVKESLPQLTMIKNSEPILEKMSRVHWQKSTKEGKSTRLITINCKKMERGKENDNQNSYIRAKVEEGFREANKQQALGRNILSSVILDPGSMLSASFRRGLPVRGCEKIILRRFEKPAKSGRIRLRVGGVRLSLQEYQRHKGEAAQNA